MQAARPRALGPAVSRVLVPAPIPARVLLYKYHLILLVGCRPALPQLHPLHGMGGCWALTYHGVPGTSLATCSMPRAL